MLIWVVIAVINIAYAAVVEFVLRLLSPCWSRTQVNRGIQGCSATVWAEGTRAVIVPWTISSRRREPAAPPGRSLCRQPGRHRVLLSYSSATAQDVRPSATLISSASPNVPTREVRDRFERRLGIEIRGEVAAKQGREDFTDQPAPLVRA